MSPAAFVLEALRTPYGRCGGVLSGWHPVDLAGELLDRLLRHAGVPASLVEGVVLGCTSQVGAQTGNIARRAALAAGWPETVPGTTLDCHATSSAQAAHWAAAAVMSGAEQLVVAGGVEVGSAVPLGACLAQPEVGKPIGRRLAARYPGGQGMPPPGPVAEEVARKWGFARGDLDAWAFDSHRKARASQASSPLYLLPVTVLPPAGGAAREGRKTVAVGPLRQDEGLGTALGRAAMRSLPPAYTPGGLVTAANMASEGDGASGVVVASAALARKLAVTPKARFLSLATAAGEPGLWPLAAVPAARRALHRAQLTPASIDWWYVHESSAAGVLAWAAEMGVPLGQVNPEGGSLASTAPAGAVGTGLFSMAVASLAAGRGRRVAVCVAGEGGNATACVLTRAT